MKQLFIISTLSWDTDTTWELYHKEIKTQEQFQKDVNECIKKYTPEVYNKYKNTKEIIHTIDILRFIIPKLIEDYKYVQTKPINYNFSDDIINEENTPELKSLMGNNIFNKIEKHNNKNF
jgi:hypothetical protein